ncbi:MULTISPECIES: hypothetical protein [unclassified Kribbella]|uniref:hypothetical protein n=1 Tax=unclassified Kribbella TaxID=2644121 RepID=UPI0033E10862
MSERLWKTRQIVMLRDSAGSTRPRAYAAINCYWVATTDGGVNRRLPGGVQVRAGALDDQQIPR